MIHHPAHHDGDPLVVTEGQGHLVGLSNRDRVSSVERNGSGVALRTLDYENPGSTPVLLCENLGQVISLYIVPVHSAVYMSTWLYTVVDMCTRNLRALNTAYGWMLQ